MGYIVKAPTGGGGGGDATAANQTTQINEATTTNDKLTVGTGGASVFKDNIQNSVFTSVGNNESYFFKTLNNRAGAVVNPNIMSVISFTDVTAAGVAGQMSTWLASNFCFVVGFTSSQGAGTHDLFLMYSV
jgi:hypothetical protein